MTYDEAVQTVKIIDALIKVKRTTKIINSFTSTFKLKHIIDECGNAYIQGSFHFGPVSGRLSSSGPNLQNIPANSEYAKWIKKCFKACDSNWIMVGADFASLEDKISALTTQDPNKIKVYVDGYDGHCLRAYFYFKHLMPDIIDTVTSINSIAEIYKSLRQDSKAPTFALTYQGTYYTLMKNLGFTKEKAKSIEAKYHNSYAVSDKWVQDRLAEAAKVGYVKLAFGLRLRTPLMHKTIMHTSRTPYEAQKESRTAGNALGQSWCMLNNRAGIELQDRLWKSPYIYDIKPIAQIHDAQYFLVKKDPNVIKWLNDNLVECMLWQEDPLIQHPTIKLGGSLEIFWPTWDDHIEVPNFAPIEEIEAIMLGVN